MGLGRGYGRASSAGRGNGGGGRGGGGRRGCSKGLAVRRLRRKILKIFDNYKKLQNINYISFQQGEVKDTFGSNKKFVKYFKINKKTKIEKGIEFTIKWFRKYYKIKK